MLNPRNYLEDCIRFDLKDLWATGLPWPAVNAAIDTGFNYSVPDAGKAAFVEQTGLNWTNEGDSLTKTLLCPRCNQQLNIPWTTSGQNEKLSYKEYVITSDCTNYRLTAARIIDMDGTGYGDRSLSHICHKCGGEINHEFLRVAKFKKETENLILKDWPLGGTILNSQFGAPVPPSVPSGEAPDQFPNRLIALELRSRILEMTIPSSNFTMNDVKGLIEAAIADKAVVKRVNSKGTFESGVLKRTERLSIRKMMSRYWENDSIFALELGGAVLRQGTFIDKMKNLDWLHSPAAQNTMNRLLLKYERYIHIIQTNPLHTAVPTLDVDLGWHTHQLSPKSYFTYTVQKCKKFIDHDDKIDEEKLSTGFEWTSKTYQKLFNEIYSECTCWYCEAIRSRHVSSTGRIFGTSKHEKAQDNFYDSGAAQLCPPDNSAHISSHNAVKVEDTTSKAAISARLHAARKMELDDAYNKACKRAKAKGRSIPPRNDYYYGAWGYPYMMYGPFMAYPMYGGIYYAGDPCSMPVGAGMAGACAQGSCSGGVAAGGCGGPGGCGSGGCAGGGMSGGCGGAGGGGGCGGGGGGGGCGGGGC